MLRELRKRSRGKAFTTFFVCILVVMALIVGMWFLGLRYIAGGIPSLDDLNDDQITKEQFVGADIGFFIDCFCYYTENSVVKEKDYLIPVGEKSYMGVRITGKKRMDRCDAMVEQVQEYIDGKCDTLDDHIIVFGTIMPMTGEHLRYYQEYYQEMNVEDQSIFIPYMLHVNCFGEIEFVYYIGGALIALAVLIGGIVCLVKSARGSYEKMITDYCKASGNYDRTLEEIETFYDRTLPCYDFRISDRYFMAPHGKKTIFLDENQILWVYQKTTEHRTYGVKTGMTYGIMVKLRDGSFYEWELKKEQYVKILLQQFDHCMPHLIIGYSDQLNQIYNKNREEMIAEVERRLAEARGTVMEDVEIENPLENGEEEIFTENEV